MRFQSSGTSVSFRQTVKRGQVYLSGCPGGHSLPALYRTCLQSAHQITVLPAPVGSCTVEAVRGSLAQ